MTMSQDMPAADMTQIAAATSVAQDATPSVTATA